MTNLEQRQHISEASMVAKQVISVVALTLGVVTVAFFCAHGSGPAVAELRPTALQRHVAAEPQPQSGKQHRQDGDRHA